MCGLQPQHRWWTELKTRLANEAGATMTEYSIMLTGLALTVIAGLAFLGIGVGGSFSIDGIFNRGGLAFECKDDGWQDLINPTTGEPFVNQGQCIQYVKTGK